MLSMSLTMSDDSALQTGRRTYNVGDAVELRFEPASHGAGNLYSLGFCRPKEIVETGEFSVFQTGADSNDQESTDDRSWNTPYEFRMRETTK